MTPAPLTDAELKEALRMVDAATPGPWEHHNWDVMEAPHVVATLLWDGKSTCNGSFDVARTRENVAFIAASRELVPRLIKELQEARESREEVLNYCRGHTEYMWAAKIVGILLGCNFQDAQQMLATYDAEKK